MARATSDCTARLTSGSCVSGLTTRYKSTLTAWSLTSMRTPSPIPRRNSRLTPPGTGLMRATPGTPSADRRAMVSSTSGAITVLPRRGVSALITLSHHHPAVHTQHLAGDVCGLVRGKEGDGVGDFFRGAPAAQRDGFQRSVFELGGQVIRQRGGDEARGDGVDGDVARGDLAGERFGQANQTRLARRVIRLPGVPGDARDGGDVDDAPVAFAQHGLDGGLRAVECALEVGLNHDVPVGLRHQHNDHVPRGARVVYEDVQPAVRLDRGLDQAFSGFEIGDIRLDGPGFAARLLDFLYRRVCALGVFGVVDDDFRAALAKFDGNGLPDAARGAGDDG